MECSQHKKIGYYLANVQAPVQLLTRYSITTGVSPIRSHRGHEPLHPDPPPLLQKVPSGDRLAFPCEPGVHQEECGQQVEGGSPSPLLCPSEASSGVLCPVLVQFWAPSSRNMRSYWREPSGGLRRWWGNWSIWPMRKGWGSLCSAWRREGWEGT